MRVAPTLLMKLDSSLQKAKSSLGLRWKNDGLLCNDPSLEVPVILLQDEVPTPWLNWKHSRASPPPNPEDREMKVWRAAMAGAVATARHAGCWTQTRPSSARTLLSSEEIAGTFTLQSSLKCGK